MKDTTIVDASIVMCVIIAIALLCGVALYYAETHTDLRLYHMPECAEDVVLVGVGDYVDGRWTAYVCGPAVDDFR